jgi:hypothetical protein
VIALARALKITTDVLLGVKPPKVERTKEDPEARPAAEEVSDDLDLAGTGSKSRRQAD